MPRIEVLRQEYAGEIIDGDELDRLKTPKRLTIDDHALCSQLRVPRDILNTYMRKRITHHASPVETAMKWGMQPVEIAGLGLMMHLNLQCDISLHRGSAIMNGIMEKQLSEGYAAIVLCVVSTSNKRTEVALMSGERFDSKGNPGTRPILEPGMERYTTAFDFGEYTRAVAEALEVEPLKLPSIRRYTVALETGTAEDVADIQADIDAG